MIIRHVYRFVLWIALETIPLLAHHSFNAEYDFTKPVTLSGLVVKWELINPMAGSLSMRKMRTARSRGG